MKFEIKEERRVENKLIDSFKPDGIFQISDSRMKMPKMNAIFLRICQDFREIQKNTIFSVKIENLESF